MRGISPVIATVIILAVTIAIAVAVIGWITGLFGAATGGTEQLQIMPDSYINATEGMLYLHVVNKGSDVTIYKVEVSGLGEVTGGNVTTTVKAGQDTWLTGMINGAVPGTTYTVKVYTKNGNVFTASIIAKR